MRVCVYFRTKSANKFMTINFACDIVSNCWKIVIKLICNVITIKYKLNISLRMFTILVKRFVWNIPYNFSIAFSINHFFEEIHILTQQKLPFCPVLYLKYMVCRSNRIKLPSGLYLIWHSILQSISLSIFNLIN